MNKNTIISFERGTLSLLCVGLFFMFQIIGAEASVEAIYSNIQPVVAVTTGSSPNPLLVAKNAALQMTATLENSTTQLQFNYAENINDGRGITFGIIGFCTGTYDGNQLIKYYTTLNPNNVLAKYIPALDAIDNGPHASAGGDGNASVVGLTNFIKDVQGDTDPLFKTAQLYELDQLYWNPAVSMFNKIGAKNNLTLAFIYDMSVRQGSDGAQSIIDSATSQLGGTPATGISENTYLSKLITLRDAALKKEGLDDTDRDDGFKTVLSSGNVGLATPFTFTAYGDSFTIVANANGIDIGDTTTKYALTVSGGTGSGSYVSGASVNIVAGVPAAGKIFDKWSGDTTYVSNLSSDTAIVTMPAKAISLTATYKTTGTNTTCTNLTPAQIASVVSPRMVAANRVTGAMGTSQEGTKSIYVYDLDYTGPHKGQYYAVVSSMAIDTDGSDANSDPDHQSETAFQDAQGKQLSAKRVPWWVIDDVATSLPNFPYGSKFNMDGFQVGAMIYPSSKASAGTAKMVYGILGDTQGSEDSVSDLNHIGEGSIAAADALGIPDSGTTGGVDGDVMYVFSTGAQNRVIPSNGYTGTNASLASDSAKAGASWMCQMIADLGGSVTPSYTLTVNSGTGSGSFASGQAVTISASAPSSGKVFDKWTGDTTYVSSVTYATTTVIMPAKAITLTATYKDSTVVNTNSLSATIIPNNVTSVAKGTTNVQLISVKLTNTGTEDINVTGVEIPGSYAPINEANTALYLGDTKLGTPTTTIDTRVTFTGLSINISKGNSITLTLKGDILTTNIRTAMTFYIEDTTIVTAKGATSATAPKVTIGGSSSVLTITAAPSSSAALSITLIPNTVTQVDSGTPGVQLISYKVSNTGTENLYITSMGFTGNFKSDSLSNVSLYINNKNSGAADSVNDTEAVFSTIQFVIAKGETFIFTLKGDVSKTAIAGTKTFILDKSSGVMIAKGMVSGEGAAITLTADNSSIVIKGNGSSDCKPYGNIKDGSMIRLKGGIDVYLVKYVGCKKFKRLIINPTVLKKYKHLKWKNVISVNKTTFESFTTSNLVQVAGDSKIWMITSNRGKGKKTLVTDTNFDPDSIFQINAAELTLYKS